MIVVSESVCTLYVLEVIPLGVNDTLVDKVKHTGLFFAGETMFVDLQGNAVDVDVRLDKTSIIHTDTYIGLCSQRYLYL